MCFFSNISFYFQTFDYDLAKSVGMIIHSLYLICIVQVLRPYKLSLLSFYFLFRERMLVLMGTNEYSLTKEDVGRRLAFVYIPVNFEGELIYILQVT